MLEARAALHKDIDGSWFTSHITRTWRRSRRWFPSSTPRRTTVDTNDRVGLIGRRSVLAHSVHVSDDELAMMRERDVVVAHCPTSNAALGSGMFPMQRHVERGVRVSLGSDVGGGTGFSLLKEGLQAFFTQQHVRAAGSRLTPAHLLYLATRAGADALGLAEVTGHLSVGRGFDAVWLRPPPGSTLDTALRHAQGPDDALAKAFSLGTVGDTGVWVGGTRLLG